jgi:5,10-methylenetetrahydromethanopterin reductase
MLRFGISMTPGKPINEWVKLAKTAEELGIENLWVADESPSPPFRDVFVTMTAIALQTKKAYLGTSICNPYSRHPAVLAVSMMSVDEISNGRAVIGLGPGGSLPLIPLAIERREPAKTVRATVEILRKLFNGETVSYDGDVFKLHKVKLFSTPKRKMRIYLAARGPMMLGLVGEVADGGLLTAIHPSILDKSINLIEKGAEKSGRTLKDIDVAYVLRFSVSKDSERARELVKPNIAYGVADLPPDVLRAAGIRKEAQEEMRKALGERGLNAAADLVTDKMIDAIAVAGTPEECIEKAKKFLRRGITQLTFGSPYGPDPQESISTLCKEIIPALSDRKVVRK